MSCTQRYGPSRVVEFALIAVGLLLVAVALHFGSKE